MLSRWRSWSGGLWLAPRPPRFLVGAIAALALAAGLVLHLERLAASEHEQQVRANLQQICERTATFAAQRLRSFFGGAASETIEGIGHPTYKRYDMERITAEFTAGARRYPYVDGFLLWSERFSGSRARQMVFFLSSRASAAGFQSVSGDGLPAAEYMTHAVLGPQLFDVAMAHVPTRLGWAVTDVEAGGRRYQAVLHFLWEDGTRNGVFAVVGLLVDLTRLRTGLFPAVFESEQFDFLRSGGTNLAISIRDERGLTIHGSRLAAEAPTSSASVSALFFPSSGMERWTQITSQAAPWAVIISAAPPQAPPALRRWLSFSLLMLLVIALYCAVSVERQAMGLSRMQSDFIASVTHQLKTPLALLAGAAETLALRRVSTPEKVSEYAEIVRSETERLTELVHNILEVSRVEAQPTPLVRQPVNIGALVARATKEFGMGIPDGVTLRAEIPSRPLMAAADPRAIEQVVLNLLDNAVKYGEQKNVVTVRVELRGNEVVVHVRDNGVGIHPEDLPHIFEKFYRGRNYRNDRRGFGLGLGIVEAIVRGHGGRVDVTSEIGIGSEFSVALRAHAA